MTMTSQQKATIAKESARIDDLHFTPQIEEQPTPETQDHRWNQREDESIARQFIRACPGYLQTPRNYSTLTKTMAFNALPASQLNDTTDEIVADLIDGGFWTVANLIACYHALDREGILDVSASLVRVRREDDAMRQYVRRVLDAAVLALVERLGRNRREW